MRKKIKDDNAGFEPLWTVRQLAAFLQVSTVSIYKLLAEVPGSERALPAIKLPTGVWRFEPDAIRSWLADHRQDSQNRTT